MFCIWISDLKDLCRIKVLNVTFISSVNKSFLCSKYNPLHVISPSIVSWICSFYLVLRIMCHICSSGIYRSLTCPSLLNYPAANCSLLLETGGRVCDGEKRLYLFMCSEYSSHLLFKLHFLI